MVRVAFEASDTLFGISQAISALGMLLGSVLAGTFKKWLQINYFPHIISLMALACLPLAIVVHPPLFTNMPFVPFWLFNLTVMLLMILLTFVNITVFTLVQAQVPSHHLGKIITIANLTTPAGQSLFGLLMEQLTDRLPILFLIIASLTMGVAILAKKIFKPFTTIYNN